MSGRSFTVLGALGPGLHAPLLAELRWGEGFARRVVLGRPSRPECAPLAAVRDPRLASEEDRAVLEGTALGVFPWVEGVDVAALLDQAPGGLELPALTAIARGVQEALEVAPVPHGALGATTIRVTPAGRVVLVGFRGDGEADRDTLADLLEDWGSDGASLGSAVRQGELQALPPAGADALAQLVHGVPDPLLHAHPWVGRALAERTEAAIPPKARTAAFAALTLILGLFSGFFLASR